MLGDLRERFRDTGYHAEVARHAVARLNQWLEEHIGRIDTQLRPLADQASR